MATITNDNNGSVDFRAWGDNIDTPFDIDVYSFEDENSISIDVENGALLTKSADDFMVKISRDSGSFESLIRILETYDVDSGINIEKRNFVKLSNNGEVNRLSKEKSRVFTMFVSVENTTWDADTISFKFAEDSITKSVKDNTRTKIDLLKSKDIKGNDISELEFETLTLEGRDLFKEARWRNATVDDVVNTNRRQILMPLSFQIFSNFPNESQNVIVPKLIFNPQYPFPAVEDVSLFWWALTRLNPGEETTSLKGTFSLDCQIEVTQILGTIQMSFVIFKYEDKTSSGGGKYEFTGTDILDDFDGGQIIHQVDVPFRQVPGEAMFYDVDVTTDFVLEGVNEGDSFSMYLVAPDLTTFSTTTINNIDFYVSQDSKFEQTTARSLRIYKFIERHFEVLGIEVELFAPVFGKISDGYSENGIYSDILMSSGSLFRNLAPSNRKMNVTLNDTFDFLKSLSLGFRVENISNIFRFHIDTYDKLFIRDLPIIKFQSRVKEQRAFYSDLIYNSVTAGTKDNGDYEEIHGLQEPLLISDWAIQKNSDKNLDLTFRYITSMAAQEISRRLQLSIAPTTDNKFDKEIFAVHAVDFGSGLRPVKWTEYFDNTVGLFSVETAYNGFFLPSEIIKRNFEKIAPCLQNIIETGKNINNISSVGLNDITTERNSQIQNEFGAIDISLLGIPNLSIYTIKFTHELTDTDRATLEGTSIVNNVEVSNFSRLIEMRDSGNNTQRGWIIDGILGSESETTIIRQNE